MPDFPEPEDELGDQSSDDELEEPHQPSADTAVAVARSARVVFIVRLFYLLQFQAKGCRRALKVGSIERYCDCDR